MKKVLSLVLVIAMVLSSMSFAFAGTFTDIADTDYTKAIETLTALGIVTGYEDGTYRPEKVVTRAEMAKLMVEILGYGDLVAGSKSQFTDTQGHWADAWIALAAGKAIVLGDGNGKFRPDATVSYDEAITMVVRALGYTDASNELKVASWPTNFKIKAAELGLTDDVKLSNTGADRGGVAQLLYNALTATLVTVNSDGDVIKSTTQTTDNQGKVVVTYTELLSRIATLDTNYDVDEDTLDPDSKNYGGDKVDLAPYMYQNLDVYLNDADEVVYVKGTNSVIVEGTVSDILNATDLSYYDEEITSIAAGALAKVVVKNSSNKELKVAVTDYVQTYFNNEAYTLQVEDFIANLYKNAAAKVTAIVNDANDNGKVDNNEVATALVVQKATEGIQVKSDYVSGKTKIYGVNATINLPEEDGDVLVNKITVTGAVDSLEDIEKDDVVIVYAAKDGNPMKLVVVRDTVEGLVTKTSLVASTSAAGTTVYIDGVKYSLSKVVNAVAGGAVEAGDEGVFYLDDAGKIFAADTEGAALTDYAIVLDKANGVVNTRYSSNYSVSEDAELKLLTQDGDKVTLPVLAVFDGITLDEYATIDGANHPLLNNSLVFTGLNEGDLIRYSVNSDGYIDEVEFVNIDTDVETLNADELEDITTDETVVFFENVISQTKSEYSVVDLASVKDGSATVVYFTGANSNKIAVIYTTHAASVNDGTYGVITSVEYALNKDGDKVRRVTAFVDGEEVEYFTSTASTAVARSTTDQAVKFSFNSSDELTGVTPVTVNDGTNIVVYDAITSIDSNYVVVGQNSYRYATDCVVYTYDESADTWTIGDKTDIDEDAIATAAYAIDTNDSSRIDIVVQVVR